MLRNILNACLSPTSLSLFLDVSLQTRWPDSKVIQRHDSCSSPFLSPHQGQGCHHTESTCNSQSQSPAVPGSSQVPCTRPPVISISTKCSHLPQISLPCHFFKSSVKGKWKEKHSDALLAEPPSIHSFHSIARTLRRPGTVALLDTRVTRQRPCSVELPFS